MSDCRAEKTKRMWRCWVQALLSLHFWFGKNLKEVLEQAWAQGSPKHPKRIQKCSGFVLLEVRILGRETCRSPGCLHSSALQLRDPFPHSMCCYSQSCVDGRQGTTQGWAEWCILLQTAGIQSWGKPATYTLKIYRSNLGTCRDLTEAQNAEQTSRPVRKTQSLIIDFASCLSNLWIKAKTKSNKQKLQNRNKKTPPNTPHLLVAFLIK